MKLVFATNNKHKLSEVRAVLGEGYELVTLAEVGITDNVQYTDHISFPSRGIVLRRAAAPPSARKLQKTNITR